MSIRAKSIPFVAYPVTDIERSKEFYERIIGLKCILDHPLAEGKRWVEFDVGSSAIAISDIMGPAGQGAVGAALEVEDFDYAIQRLKEEGVTFVTDLMESPSCRFCVIADPDGNDLTIHKSNE